MVVLRLEIFELFDEEEIISFFKKDWLFIDASVKDMVEGILESKSWTSGHF